MPIPITALYAGILAFLLVALSIRVVVVVRAKGKVNYGDDGNPEFGRVVRAQGNFVEYVPMALLLMGIAELNGSNPTWLHGMGVALVLARLLHPLGLRAVGGPSAARVIGTSATWIVLAIGGVLAIGHAVSAA